MKGPLKLQSTLFFWFAKKKVESLQPDWCSGASKAHPIYNLQLSQAKDASNSSQQKADCSLVKASKDAASIAKGCLSTWSLLWILNISYMWQNMTSSFWDECFEAAETRRKPNDFQILSFVTEEGKKMYKPPLRKCHFTFPGWPAVMKSIKHAFKAESSIFHFILTVPEEQLDTLQMVFNVK